MKNIIIITVFCVAQLITKANASSSIITIKQDSICACNKNVESICCKQPASKYYGNPLTLSPKEKMKYEIMNAGNCCNHNNKKRKNNRENYIKEPVNKK